MSKYDQLWKHLQTNGSPILKLAFEEIKTILGFDIAHSFLTYKKEASQFGYQAGKISWLLDFWGKKNILGLIMIPITRHQTLHLNDCFNIKEKATAHLIPLLGTAHSK
jgi:hypothetical protein